MAVKKYQPQRKADENQTKARKKMRGKKAFALLMAMRMRKSKVLVDDFGEMELEGKVKDLMVIAPGGVYRTWVDILRGDLSEDLKERITVHVWQSGSGITLNRDRQTFLKTKEPRALIMNIEALSRPGEAREFAKAFLKQRNNVVGIDECFPAGTMITTPFGPKAIEKLNVGDFVTGALTNQKISTIMKNKLIVLKIRLSNGTEITTTDSHPFFTDLGWMRAKDITGRYLYGQKEMRELWKIDQEENLPFDDQERHREILRNILRCEMEDFTTFNKSQNVYARTKQETKHCYEREGIGNFTLEQGNSNARYFSQKIKGNIEEDWTYIFNSWRQWQTTTKGSGNIIKGSWSFLDCRITNKNERWSEAWRLSALLQSGSWPSKKDVGDRMRWTKPQQSFEKNFGQEEGCQVERIRVESVTIEEQRYPVDVFNIELEGAPHFFAEGIFVHNSTRIKNKSKRTDFVIKAIKPKATYRRILSGLVAPRAPLDLFYQYNFLDSKILGWNSWYAFRAHVAYMKQQWFGGRSVMLIDKDQGNNGYKPEAIKELQKLTAPHSYRVEFRPKVPTTYSIREVEMTKEQIKAYKEMKEFATTMLANEAHVTATVVIAQIMKLHQILCGHVKDEEGVEHLIPENKTAELLDLLDDYGGKAIIWCSYDVDVKKVVEALTEEYGKGSVARFWGGNTKTRDAEEKLFKEDPNCRFMVATPDSGGMGRTWDIADLAVYYSSRDNLEHRDQSEQRTMGRDKARGVDVVDLICPGTVETKILEALRNKINMATAINGDTWREWVM
jgi:hypothetical protein